MQKIIRVRNFFKIVNVIRYTRFQLYWNESTGLKSIYGNQQSSFRMGLVHTSASLQCASGHTLPDWLMRLAYYLNNVKSALLKKSVVDLGRFVKNGQTLIYMYVWCIHIGRYFKISAGYRKQRESGCWGKWAIEIVEDDKGNGNWLWKG